MRTKVIVVGLLLGMGIGWASAPRPRFENLYEETVEGHSANAHLIVYHDRESGQEFICNYGPIDSARTCWSTGRNWK